MTIGVNDYPWASSTNLAGFDTWGYAIRECASFVAWRLSNDLGANPVPKWGNASSFASKAAAAGTAVDSSPAAGSILQLPPGHNGAGADGHVAFVLEVGPSANAPAGSVFVEDYNYGTPYGYNRHTIPVSGSNFIHVGTGTSSAGSSPLSLTAQLTAASSSGNPLSAVGGVLGGIGSLLSGQIFVWGGEVVIGALMLIAGLWLNAGKPGSTVIQAAGAPVTAAAAVSKVKSRSDTRKRAAATRSAAQERDERTTQARSQRALERATRPRRRVTDVAPPRPRAGQGAELAAQGRTRVAREDYRRHVQSVAPRVPF